MIEETQLEIDQLSRRFQRLLKDLEETTFKDQAINLMQLKLMGEIPQKTRTSLTWQEPQI